MFFNNTFFMSIIMYNFRKMLKKSWRKFKNVNFGFKKTPIFPLLTTKGFLEK